MCSEVLEADPENAATLKDRAEAYIQDEQYEEGRRSSGSPTPPPPTFSEVVNTRDPIEVSGGARSGVLLGTKIKV